MFKYLKLKLKHRKLLHKVEESEYNVEQEFAKVQQQLGMMFASPSFDLLVEYIEAQIEVLRDKLEIQDCVKTRAKLEVYRDLINLFNQPLQDIEDTPTSDS
jgi:hypothetical protein